VAGFYALVTDITERKRNMDALRRAEERFRASQEASLFGFTILNAVRGAGGRVIDFEWEYVNPAAASILKRPAGELVGRRLLQVLPNNRESSDLFERYVDVVETGKPHDYELRYRAEGIDGWFRNMTVKLGDGVAVSFTDITERLRKEEELRASEARFRQLAEAMPEIVWVAEASGKNTYINRQWSDYTGRTTEEGLSDRWADSVHPDDRPSLCEQWAAALRNGTPYTAEYRLRGKDGAFRWQIVRGVPIRDPAGRVILWYGSSTDIHEPKRLAEALRDADRRKDAFLATLAHELRNPLAPISNSLELMKRARGNAETMEWARSTIERQVAQMVRLVDDLLDVSRITRDKLELKKEDLHLRSRCFSSGERSRSPSGSGRTVQGRADELPRSVARERSSAERGRAEQRVASFALALTLAVRR
jgi:PAS domain S-box-containing protein